MSAPVVITHNIPVPTVNLCAISNQVGACSTHKLVDWNGKNFSMKVYRTGIDVNTTGYMCVTYHVDTTNYDVPLIVSFQLNISGNFNTNVHQQFQTISSTIKTSAFTFSPIKSNNYAVARCTDISSNVHSATLNFIVTLSIQLWQPPVNHSLSNDLAALLESAIEEGGSESSSAATDVTIIADEGTVRLPAMKSLLCARSAVFRSPTTVVVA